MLSSISPVGEYARDQRWSSTVTAYLLGSLLGGVMMGAVAGGSGMLLLGTYSATTRLLALAVATSIGLLADRWGRVPTLHRQVDQRWLSTYRGWVYGAGFGLQLGVGVVTIVPSSIVWVLWVGAVLTADIRVGIAVGAVFGVGRALPLVAGGRIATVGQLRGWMQRMDRSRSAAARTTSVAQGVVGVIGVAVWAFT
ncbi:MAG: hypothetical protein ACR2HR_09880 [Euzebya sp.]